MGVRAVKVKVFGLKYDVIETDHIDEWGRIDHNDLKIFLRKGMADPVRTITLWHELIHAIEYATGLNLGEQTVDVLASGIYSILNDNGSLRQAP